MPKKKGTKHHPMRGLIIRKFGSIKNFSEKVGVPYGVIINYIRMIRKPEPKRAKLLARKLGTSVEKIIDTYKVTGSPTMPKKKATIPRKKATMPKKKGAKHHPMRGLIIREFGSIKNFSEKVGISYGVIINYIRMIRTPGSERAKLFARKLGVSVDKIMSPYEHT